MTQQDAERRARARRARGDDPRGSSPSQDACTGHNQSREPSR